MFIGYTCWTVLSFWCKRHMCHMDCWRQLLKTLIVAFYVFSDVLDFIEVECFIYRNVQYVIISKNCVLNFTAVTYSLHQCRETMLKCHLFCRVGHIRVHGSKKTNLLPSNSDLNLVIPHSRELCNKNCIVKTSEMLIVWNASCYTAGSDKPGRNNAGTRLTAKRSAMVFRVHSRHDELTLTYWCS